MNTNEQISHEELKQNIADTLKHLDKMGIDSSEFFNTYEIEYFNERFKDFRKNFDFEEKKICFFGPGGLVFSDKQKYFNSLKNNHSHIQDDLYIFNEFEKEESEGYDAVIVYWSKRIYSSKDLVKRMKEKH
ncbi:MAG: hypothetical protein PHS04_18875 [Tissierellia bacterium]|jgi:hypothetical protein|nr:hypothetical protein [Tissierellia bacterium]